MTENLDDRLAALQARRGHPNTTPRTARPIPTADPAGNEGSATDPDPVTPTARPTRPAKRAGQHAAPASRILALGLSASAAIAMTGIMTRSAASPTTAAEPSASAIAAPTPAPIVVHVVLPNGQVVQGTQTPTAAPAIAAAQPAARTTTNPTVVTRSRAS